MPYSSESGFLWADVLFSQTPMSYLQSQHSPSLWENIPCKLLVLAPFPSHPASIWFNVCVIVIALRWKGLASHNAKKKKKKKVPSLQHEHFLQWRGLCPPHLFTTAGAFFVLEGYFVLPAALSAVTVATHFSVSLWWCRHTCRHKTTPVVFHRPSRSESIHLPTT